MTLAAHTRVHGPLPEVARAPLIEEVERSGLRGRGGADFPTAGKLRAVAERRRVRRGDRQRLRDRAGEREGPAAAGAAAAPGARRRGARGRRGRRATGDRQGRRNAADAVSALEGASRCASATRCRFEVVPAPEGYVAGEESAVVHYLNGGGRAADVRAAAAVRAGLSRAPDADPEPRDARAARARRPLRIALVPRARHGRRSRARRWSRSPARSGRRASTSSRSGPR